MIHTPLSVLQLDSGDKSGLAAYLCPVRFPGGEAVLSGSELRDLCCAIELDRVSREDAVRLLRERARSGRRLEWCGRGDAGLVAGARGLSQSDAPGGRTVAAILAGVGCEVGAVQLAVQSPREALARVRGQR